MNNITLNLPDKFKLRATEDYLFYDCETGVLQTFSKEDPEWHTVYKYKGIYIIIYSSPEDSNIFIIRTISADDLIRGITKGKLIYVDTHGGCLYE